jgi:hypothetical protein
MVINIYQPVPTDILRQGVNVDWLIMSAECTPLQQQQQQQQQQTKQNKTDENSSSMQHPISFPYNIVTSYYTVVDNRSSCAYSRSLQWTMIEYVDEGGGDSNYDRVWRGDIYVLQSTL